MDIQECATIKECLLWAEERWEGFWEFANQKPMAKTDIQRLAVKLDKDEQGFELFMGRVKDVAKEDKTKEALLLLFKGAGAFTRLERVLNEDTRTKR